MKPDAKQLVVYLPDTRGVTISRWGHGNTKIGPGVYTYSRLPGSPENAALGYEYETDEEGRFNLRGTCPGASEECQSICYARRPVEECGAVLRMWEANTVYREAPEAFPDDCTLVRLHVSGDFDTVRYIESWIRLCEANPQVTVWGYTRSWRVAELLPALERLRALPNVQLFASIDQSISELPPEGWRRAWIDGDERAGDALRIPAHYVTAEEIAAFQTVYTADGVKSLICPEETKAVANCEQCGFCFRGKRNDVVFLRH